MAVYIGRPLLTHSTFHARAKIFSSQKIESRFGSQKFPSLGLGQKFLPCRFGRKFSVWRLGESFLKRSEWYDPYISNDDGTLKSLIFSITKQQLPINNHQIPPAYRQAGTPPFSKGGGIIFSLRTALCPLRYVPLGCRSGFQQMDRQPLCTTHSSEISNHAAVI